MTEQVPAETLPEAPQASVEELQQQLAEKDGLIESIKKAQSGVDAKNTELRTELESLRNDFKEKLSDSEREKYEAQKAIDEKDALAKRFEEMESREKARDFRELKTQILKDNDLTDITLIDTLSGSSSEEFQKSVLWYKEALGNTEQKIKSNIMNQDQPPKGGQEGTGMTQEKFNALSMSEANRLFKTDPDTYNKFKKRK